MNARRPFVSGLAVGAAAMLALGVVLRLAGCGVPEPIDRAQAAELASARQALESRGERLRDALIDVGRLRADSAARADAQRAIERDAAAARRENRRHEGTIAELRAAAADRPDVQELADSLEAQHGRTVGGLEGALATSNAERLRLGARVDSLVPALRLWTDSIAPSLRDERDFWRGEAERLESDRLGFNPFGFIESKAVREVLTLAACSAVGYGAERLDRAVREDGGGLGTFLGATVACEVGVRLGGR